MEKREYRWCRDCEAQTPQTHHQMISDRLGVLLTIFTGGGFLIVWLPLIILDSFQSWSCEMCGNTRRLTFSEAITGRLGRAFGFVLIVVAVILVAFMTTQ